MKTSLRKLLLAGSAFLLCFLISCGGEKTTTSYVMENQTFSFSGPLYGGPESAQVAHKFELGGVIPQGAKIKEVKLVKATVIGQDGANLAEEITSFSLNISSSDAPMKLIAVKNPADPGSRTSLQTAEVKLKEYFKPGTGFTLILDADFKEESDDDVDLTGSFEFQITYTL